MRVKCFIRAVFELSNAMTKHVKCLLANPTKSPSAHKVTDSVSGKVLFRQVSFRSSGNPCPLFNYGFLKLNGGAYFEKCVFLLQICWKQGIVFKLFDKIHPAPPPAALSGRGGDMFSK